MHIKEEKYKTKIKLGPVKEAFNHATEGEVCASCGEDGTYYTIDFHHTYNMWEDSKGNIQILNNLGIFLCRRCHHLAHFGKYTLYEVINDSNKITISYKDETKYIYDGFKQKGKFSRRLNVKFYEVINKSEEIIVDYKDGAKFVYSSKNQTTILYNKEGKKIWWR